jgi:hypothetical protein
MLKTLRKIVRYIVLPPEALESERSKLGMTHKEYYEYKRLLEGDENLELKDFKIIHYHSI